ncbi:MAG: hypothetical protein ACLVL7_13975 [Anaerotruncus massiliensis (ex Togo et al. 2019)]
MDYKGINVPTTPRCAAAASGGRTTPSTRTRWSACRDRPRGPDKVLEGTTAVAISERPGRRR